ncbi:MAG: hypothetical protein K0S09_70 [Sphingobacteriaceae bacterium]|nr:hypothetical protein [Sphingobacteriaceae bacterium]
MQKLAQVLARIIGLKKDGEIEEAHKAIANTLSEGFSLDESFLNTSTPAEFQVFLNQQRYSEEKLNVLTQLLFESAHPFEDLLEIHNRLRLVLVVFNQLEKEYHTQSLDNIAKRQMIDKFLNTDQYE